MPSCRTRKYTRFRPLGLRRAAGIIASILHPVRPTAHRACVVGWRCSHDPTPFSARHRDSSRVRTEAAAAACEDLVQPRPACNHHHDGPDGGGRRVHAACGAGWSRPGRCRRTGLSEAAGVLPRGRHAGAVERFRHQGRGLAAGDAAGTGSCRPSATAAWRARFPIRPWLLRSPRATRRRAPTRATSATTPTSCPGIPKSSWTSPTGRSTRWRWRRRPSSRRTTADRRSAPYFNGCSQGGRQGDYERTALSRRFRRHRGRRLGVELDAHARGAHVGEPDHEPDAGQQHPGQQVPGDSQRRAAGV